eukprot:847719-Prorocentrum_minimum.AAC.1
MRIYPQVRATGEALRYQFLEAAAAASWPAARVVMEEVRDLAVTVREGVAKVHADRRAGLAEQRRHLQQARARLRTENTCSLSPSAIGARYEHILSPPLRLVPAMSIFSLPFCDGCPL